MTDQTEIITHGGADRGYKMCRCHLCRDESLCTPTNDFYTTDDDLGPLVCDTCIVKIAMQK